MKKFLIAAVTLLVQASYSFGQGEVYFVNTASSLTHIYTNYFPPGGPIPGDTRISGAGQYMFALFSADNSVDDVLPGLWELATPWTDARWQFTGNYATNTSALGRITAATPNANGAVTIPGRAAGETVGLVVVGWNIAAGGTSLVSLIDSMNRSPDLWTWSASGGRYGISSVAHILLGDGDLIPNRSVFGAGPGQISGFVLGGVIPEPSAMALIGLGSAMLVFHRRRNSRRPSAQFGNCPRTQINITLKTFEPL